MLRRTCYDNVQHRSMHRYGVITGTHKIAAITIRNCQSGRINISLMQPLHRRFRQLNAHRQVTCEHWTAFVCSTASINHTSNPYIPVLSICQKNGFLHAERIETLYKKNSTRRRATFLCFNFYFILILAYVLNHVSCRFFIQKSNKNGGSWRAKVVQRTNSKYFLSCDSSQIRLFVVIDAIAAVNSLSLGIFFALLLVSSDLYQLFGVLFFSCSDNVFIACCFADTWMRLNKIMVQNRKKTTTKSNQPHQANGARAEKRKKWIYLFTPSRFDWFKME